MNDLFIGLAILTCAGLISSASSKSGTDRVSGYIELVLFIGAMPFILKGPITVLLKGTVLTYVIHAGPPIDSLRFELDGLSSIFVIVFTVISILILIYSQGYMRPYSDAGNFLGRHYLYLSLLVVSMILVVIVRNGLSFLIVWELMSISSFFLVAFEYKEKTVTDAAVNYIVSMHIGVILLTVAFLVLSSTSGTLDFDGLKKIDSGRVAVIFLLFFFGFAFKAGLVPFHTWLPKAHPAAPGSISAMMSGIMIKTGIYGILRIASYIERPPVWLGVTVLAISLATGLFGILNAIVQKDLKRMLAFSSIENIGIIGTGIGIGMLGLAYNHPLMTAAGFCGAIIHTINHSIFKTLLFLCAGSIYSLIHSRNIELMGGLIKILPVMGVAFLIGAASISGIPPFNGFVGKFIIYSGMINEFHSSASLFLTVKIFGAATFALIGGLTALCFTKVFGVAMLGAYRGERPPHPTAHTDGMTWMYVPMVILALLCIYIGLFPGTVIALLREPLKTLHVDTCYLTSIPLDNISIGALIFVFATGALFGTRSLLLSGRGVRRSVTWGCGYESPSPRMQYTSSGFSEPMTRFIRGLTGISEQRKGTTRIFEDTLFYHSAANDIIDSGAIRKVWDSICWTLERFKWIQSGYLRHYILMILVTLIATLFASLWSISQ